LGIGPDIEKFFGFFFQRRRKKGEKKMSKSNEERRAGRDADVIVGCVIFFVVGLAVLCAKGGVISAFLGTLVIGISVAVFLKRFYGSTREIQANLQKEP
jgi:hypothetical protein